MIKTKPIASYCVDIHTEKNLRDQFEKKYWPALEHTGIRPEKYIYNIDKKEYQITCSIGEEIVVSIGIKEIYIRVPKN